MPHQASDILKHSPNISSLCIRKLEQPAIQLCAVDCNYFQSHLQKKRLYRIDIYCLVYEHSLSFDGLM